MKKSVKLRDLVERGDVSRDRMRRPDSGDDRDDGRSTAGGMLRRTESHLSCWTQRVPKRAALTACYVCTKGILRKALAMRQGAVRSASCDVVEEKIRFASITAHG